MMRGGGGNDGGGGGGAKRVPMHRLFAFANRRDGALMAVGAVAAVAMPFLAFLIGGLVDAFGAADRAHVVHEVSKVAVRFVYLALASRIAGFLQVSCWMVAGERQAARIRGLYLETILRQDISFFDVEASTGEIIERMSSDTVLIQDAIGEKVGKFLQLVSTFLGGFIIAFARGWLPLSTIMLSTIPPVVASAAVMSLVLSKLSNRSQMAYAEAGKVVE